jgi:amino acid transporter
MIKPNDIQPSVGATIPANEVRRLRRDLKLRDLIIYGIVIMTPIAPVPLFGVAQEVSRGHAVTTILIAGAAMLLTAFSYGRMANLYPSAGSAYSYVGHGLNPHLGFLAGWVMCLDYLVLPTVAVIQAALAMVRLVPHVPYPVWVAIFVGGMTTMNLGGIRKTARANNLMLVYLLIVVAFFVILAIRYLVQTVDWSGLFSLQPFYDPRTFNARAVATATSFAAMTYIGFDGVTTLAEEVENPRRNVLRATVYVCLLTAFLSCVEVYLAQLVWPDYHAFPDIETGFMDVTRRVGGSVLFQSMGIAVILSSFGAGLAAQAGAARLLYAMGRDNVVPRKLFGYLSAKHSNPSYNICMIGVLTLAGSLLLNLERAAELLNFGAFLGFMGVNMAALRQNYMLQRNNPQRRLLRDALVPVFGFLFCLGIWLSLPRLAQIVGGLWLLGGIAYGAIRTRGYRNRPVMLGFEEMQGNAEDAIPVLNLPGGPK